MNGVVRHSLHVLLSVDANTYANTYTNTETMYPGLMAGGLGVQVVVVLLMWRGGWAKRAALSTLLNVDLSRKSDTTVARLPASPLSL